MKRVIVTVTLDKDEEGNMTYHISRLRHPGMAGDDYGPAMGLTAINMADHLGTDLVGLIRAK